MRLGSLLRKWCRNQEPTVQPDQAECSVRRVSTERPLCVLTKAECPGDKRGRSRLRPHKARGRRGVGGGGGGRDGLPALALGEYSTVRPLVASSVKGENPGRLNFQTISHSLSPSVLTQAAIIVLWL
ncbi:unnamed protein product [Pleuronectes platessa]|uniref:Uncharacterized protein n=1 Tax=Pleuronectes platessa TaxID=8262 RepID=A0A9N7VZF3_PLEPL|nr:unnamed protein product [Pleuronectes platessa]